MADNPTRATPQKPANREGGKGGSSTFKDQTQPTKAPDAGQPPSQRRD